MTNENDYQGNTEELTNDIVIPADNNLDVAEVAKSETTAVEQNEELETSRTINWEITETEAEMTEEAEAQTVSQTLTVDEVSTMFKDLSDKFDQKIAVDSHKNMLFDKMYKELDSYKNDIYSKIMKPFIMDTIMLIDDTSKLLRDIDQTDAEKVFKVLKEIPDDLLDILNRNGIETFEEPDNTFNAKTQRVLRVIETDNQDLNNTVESHLRPGYKWDEKVIKQELINCYKYKEQK